MSVTDWKKSLTFNVIILPLKNSYMAKVSFLLTKTVLVIQV